MTPIVPAKRPTPRHRAWLIAGVCLALALVCVVTLFSYTIERALASLSHKQPAVQPVALLLPDGNLPGPWQAGPVDTGYRVSQLYRGAHAVAHRGYFFGHMYGETWIAHYVAWYPTVHLAVRDYRFQSRPAFADWDPWREMTDWGFQSLLADEASIQCVQGIEAGGAQVYRLRYVARYGQYVVTLNMRILSEDLNTDQVKSWAAMVDRMMLGVH